MTLDGAIEAWNRRTSDDELGNGSEAWMENSETA